MTHSKFNDIQEILSYPSLQIESEVQCDFICNLCAQIMCDACVTVCGCNYCKQCIEYVIKKGGTHCPGMKNDCRTNGLTFNKTVFPDHKTNIKIGRLVVRCPNRSCKFKTELMEMKDHIMSCKGKILKSDWNDEDECYSSIIAESINGMKSDIGVIKNRYEEQLELQMVCIDKLNKEITALREASFKKQGKIDDLEIQVCELINAVRSIQENLKTRNDDTRIIDKEDVSNNIINVELNLVEVNARLETLVYGEFLWKIDRFSKRKKEAECGIRRQIDSEPFYSHKNGYKMCLQVNPNGYDIGKGTHLSVFFAIMKGPFDDILKWPFKCKVRISLVNQKTAEDHIKQDYKYTTTQVACKNSYEKPITGNNVSLGTGQFILLEELLSNPDLVANDCIFIRCKVEQVTQ